MDHEQVRKGDIVKIGKNARGVMQLNRDDTVKAVIGDDLNILKHNKFIITGVLCVIAPPDMDMLLLLPPEDLTLEVVTNMKVKKGKG